MNSTPESDSAVAATDFTSRMVAKEKSEIPSSDMALSTIDFGMGVGLDMTKCWGILKELITESFSAVRVQ
jgi:hypothetical protein